MWPNTATTLAAFFSSFLQELKDTFCKEEDEEDKEAMSKVSMSLKQAVIN